MKCIVQCEDGILHTAVSKQIPLLTPYEKQWHIC